VEFQGHRTNSIIVNEISGSKENNLLVNGISSSKQKKFTCQWNVKVIEEAIYDLPMDNIHGHRKTVCLSMEFQVQSKKSLLANGISRSKEKEFTCQWNFMVKGRTVYLPIEFQGHRKNSLLAGGTSKS
jgi:hypothetical protein